MQNLVKKKDSEIKGLEALLSESLEVRAKPKETRNE